MMRISAVAGLLVLGACTWWIGKLLSTDAISMIFGLVVGILALLPTIVMVLAAGRRQGFRGGEDHQHSAALRPPGGRAAPVTAQARR